MKKLYSIASLLWCVEEDHNTSQLLELEMIYVKMLIYKIPQSFHISQPFGSIFLSTPSTGPWTSTPFLQYLGPA